MPEEKPKYRVKEPLAKRLSRERENGEPLIRRRGVPIYIWVSDKEYAAIEERMAQA